MATRRLILPAGYLGAALFGATLFLLANRIPRWTRALSIIIGLSIIVLTLAYAMPNDTRICESPVVTSDIQIPDQSGSATAMIIGIGFGVAMLALGWKASRIVNLFALNTLAILTGLHAVMDLWTLTRNPDLGRGVLTNDAAQFSERFTPFFSTEVVAALWAASAVMMLLVAIYFGLIKQVGGEIGEVVNGKDKA